MVHEKSCGTIIFNRNKVLLIGAKDDDGEIFWSFPKGHQEDGETDVETALRETLEETSLSVKIADQTPIIVSHLIHSGTAVKDIYLFLAKTENTQVEPQAGEVEFYKWAVFSEADKLLFDYYKTAWSEAKIRFHKNPPRL